VDWPATDDGDYARRYLGPFLTRGPEAYIANAHTALYALRAGPVLLPVTAAEFHLDNSYVCSPYAHYVSYALEEFRALKNPPAEAALRLLFRGLGVYLRRSALDRVVYVNNWLLSTNLYPAGQYWVSSLAAVGFQDLLRADFTLSPKSPYRGRGAGGTNPGANIESLGQALARFMSVLDVPTRSRP
jgi:hypothetical protein